LEAGPQPLPDDDGYLAAVQAELNDVPWYAPDDLTEFDNQEPLI
jgi:hypothetical protein